MGFQETVELGIMSTLFFGHDKQNNQILKEKFQEALNQKGQYGKGKYVCIS